MLQPPVSIVLLHSVYPQVLPIPPQIGLLFFFKREPHPKIKEFDKGKSHSYNINSVSDGF